MELNDPQVKYALLRGALEQYKLPPADLDESQKQQLLQLVNRELAIGKKLIDKCDDSILVIPQSSIDESYLHLKAAFDNDEAFMETLAYNDLDEPSLRSALEHDLSVEMATEHLLKNKCDVSEEDALEYYQQNQSRFLLPETRTVSHILITVNEDFPENSRSNVIKRMEKLHEECEGNGLKLKELAKQYSECPSAMHDGLIGRVKKGQLYSELDEALFKLQEEEISGVIETEIGMHIILCEQVHPDEMLSFDKVKEKIISLLEQKKRSSELKKVLSD